MRKILVALMVIAALLATVPASNQLVTYNALIANQSGNFTWATTAPTGSEQTVSYARYKALVVHVTPSACPIATATGTLQVTWNDVIACASSHTPSLQSEAVGGGYTTIYYNATFHSGTGTFTCSGPYGADAYSGTPITLPAGTVAPGSSTPLSLSLSSITYPGSSSITVQLENPSGGVAQTWATITTSPWSASYTTSGAAGAWSWVISQTGGSAGTCNVGSGASGGGTQMTFSGTASWYQ